MSNIQELMNLVHEQAGPKRNVFRARVERANGHAVTQTITTTRTIGEVRQLVQMVARSKIRGGFTFSVRPL